MIASATQEVSLPLVESTSDCAAAHLSRYCSSPHSSSSPTATRRTPCLFLKDYINTRGYVLIFAESFRPFYKSIQPTLSALAEAVSRPSLMHMYHLTPFSLGSAVSNGVTAVEALRFFEENTYDLMPDSASSSCNQQQSQHSQISPGRDVLPHAAAASGSSLSLEHSALRDFLSACMERYNQVRVVIDDEHTTVQCQSDSIAHILLSDPVIRSTVLPPHASYADDDGGEDGDAETAVSDLLQRGYFFWRNATDLYPYFSLKNRAMAKIVAERSVVLGYPMEQQYDYEHDTTVRRAYFSLRSQTRPRGYQVEAVEAATRDGTLHSGCLLLPCGAGKTLVGVMLMCKVRKPTLVVCAGAVSVEQWKNQILDAAVLDAPSQHDDDNAQDSHHTTTHPAPDTSDGGHSNDTTHMHRGGASSGAPSQRRRGCDSATQAASRSSKVLHSGSARIACLTGKQKDEITDDTDVVLTTYSMLVSAYRMVQRQRVMHKSASPVADAADEMRRYGSASQAHHFTQHGTRRRRANPKEKLFSPYGLMLLDEVHVIPAEAFRESLGFIDAKAVIGLTATYVREDSRILDLFHLVGPKLYDIAMDSLVRMGYLARVNCVEVHTPMTAEFATEYLQRHAGDVARVMDSSDEDISCATNNSAQNDYAANANSSSSSSISIYKKRRRRSSRSGDTGSAFGVPSAGSVAGLVLFAAANPYKMECVLELVERHLEHGAKILVFCDHLMLLHEYAKLLNAPVICGATPHRERLMIFSDFQSTARVNVICISRVGDVSVNLPRANVVLQVSSHGGSRRQEAQRLGRILRPKEPRAGHGGTEMKESAAVEAWFYSIVSVNTLETEHAARRTAFLVDQGYTCRVMEYVPRSKRGDANEGGLQDGTQPIKNSHEQPHDTHAKTEKQSTSHNITTYMESESAHQHQQGKRSHNSAGRAAPSVKTASEAVVGDAVSIKAEAMQNVLHGGRVLQRRAADSSSSGRSASLHMRNAWKQVTSVAYHIQLLSKVVSTWEMTTFRQGTQSGSAQGLSGHGAQASRDARGLLKQQQKAHGTRGEQSDEEVEVIAPRRDWQSIKKEWSGGDYVAANSPSAGRLLHYGGGEGGSRSLGGIAATATLSLEQLVGASEDFVYHEL